ncbi:Plasma membrane t-SNARE, secretory vesicle fusion [Chytridiales sp. JEL 0842]|nr:Plasma membrane t-SNARE, secretory vesicle fusion [Chytridiales sp. JEL 0842]
MQGRYPQPPARGYSSSSGRDRDPRYYNGGNGSGGVGRGTGYYDQRDMNSASTGGRGTYQSSGTRSRDDYQQRGGGGSRREDIETGRQQSSSYYNQDTRRNNYNTSTNLARSPTTQSSSATGSFFDQIEEAKQSIELIKRNIDQIKSIQSRILNSTTTDESNRYTNQLDALNDKTSNMMQQVRETMKTMSAETANMPPGAEQHSRRGQQSSVAKKLMAVAEDYQNCQMGFKQRYKARMEREIRIAQPNATEAEIKRAVENPRNGSAFAQQLMSSRSAQQRRILEDVQDRHKELLKLEQSINEIFSLFQEMQLLLDTQQEMINTIEANVENTVAYVEEGSKGTPTTFKAKNSKGN